MTSSTKVPDRTPTATRVEVDATWLRVGLADGRELAVPLAWFDWLMAASEVERADFEIIENGQGVWWTSIDEGLSVPGLLGLPHA
jgi:hypothetical protein